MRTTSSVRSRSRAVLPNCLAIPVLAAMAISVDAATITVNSFNQIDPGQCTIATAIASINAAADQSGCTHSGSYGTSDTIVLASGTYATTVANNGTNAYPIIQKALTINGNGATLSRTVGAVAPFFRFFEVQAGGLTLNNATLTGGNVPNGNGGAIFNNIGPLSVSGSTFSGNTAIGGFGGAIYHNSTEAASISTSAFTNNAVGPSATGGAGGAVYDNSSNGMTLTNATFTSNIARIAGAVYDNSTTGLTITNGTFTGNSATFAAGAIYDNSTGGLTFNGGTVTNNNANPSGLGGAIYDNSTGGIRISNVSFTGNSATTGSGGAIYDNSSVATGPVSNNCFVGNTAATGGGIFRFGAPALNAINNWWGAAGGPSGAGSGTGDSVSANVTFAPFLTSPPSICGAGPTARGLQIYWGDDGNLTIHRARLKGTNVQALVTTGLLAPQGIALDPLRKKMYWTNADKVQRSNLDGTGVQDLVTGQSDGFGIALDLSAGKMYWVDFAGKKIQRANLDGSGIELLFSTANPGPLGIALDVARGKMYWTNDDTQKIQRANLDGTNVEDLVTTGLSQPQGIALDSKNGKMYWTNFGAQKIQRANLDGTNVQDLVTGLGQPTAIAVGKHKMYWTDAGTLKIQRANLDGTGIQDVITSGLSDPVSITIGRP